MWLEACLFLLCWALMVGGDLVVRLQDLNRRIEAYEVRTDAE